MPSIAVQGHRGSPDPGAGIIENTLASFMRARELGADGVELDVRMTADGALAVHHDPVVPGVGTVAELAASALPPSVPLLASALEVCAGLVVNIEIKNLPGEPGFDPDNGIAEAVVDLVREADRASTVVISCFWPATLDAVRRAHPDLATGLLLAPWFDPDQAVATALDHGCTAIHPHVDLVGVGSGRTGPPGRPRRGHLDGQPPAGPAVGGRGRCRHRHHRRCFPGHGRPGPPPTPSGHAGVLTWEGGPIGRSPRFQQQCTAMNVVVCVKQIPDPAAPPALDPGTKNLVREGKLILDDSDSYGVEMALQLADAAGGGDVTLVSMAPNGETSGLRTALAMGAAKAILISDDTLAGTDALGTAKVLAAAIRRAEPDLVLAATESTDGYTGTTPVQIAELLGFPSVTFAKKVEITGDSVKVERQTEAGYDEVESPLPAVVTVTAGVVEPRYPSFKGIMAAKSKPVETLTVADLGIDPSQVGAAGARQEIMAVTEAEARAGGEIVTDEGEGYQRIIEFLEQLKVL